MTISKMLHAASAALVHEAWADGSSWDKVIPFLDAKGLHVVAVQFPLMSFESDRHPCRSARTPSS
jgi:hypothetical protein